MTEERKPEATEVSKRTSAKKWTESARKVRGLVRDMYVRALVEGKPVAKRGRIPGIIANPRLHRAI